MNFTVAVSIYINMRRITRQTVHGILMGALSIMAGVALTLAAPGLHTDESDATAQAAVVPQQTDTIPAKGDGSELALVIVRFHECEALDTDSRNDSHVLASRIDLAPRQRTSC